MGDSANFFAAFIRYLLLLLLQEMMTWFDINKIEILPAMPWCVLFSETNMLFDFAEFIDSCSYKLTWASMLAVLSVLCNGHALCLSGRDIVWPQLLLIIFSFLTFLNIVPHLTFLPGCTQEGAAHQKANIRCHDDRPRFHHINKVQHQTGSCPYKHAPARARFFLEAASTAYQAFQPSSR